MSWLEFDQAFYLADQLVASGRISQDAFVALGEIDRLLEEMSDGTDTYWLPEALDSDRWPAVRDLATQAVSCIE